MLPAQETYDPAIVKVLKTNLSGSSPAATETLNDSDILKAHHCQPGLSLPSGHSALSDSSSQYRLERPNSQSQCQPGSPKGSQQEISEVDYKYQIGSFRFSDRPYATLFYGQGYIDSVIIPSVPNTLSGNDRGSSTTFSSKAQYASIYSPSVRARNATIGSRFLQFLKGFKVADSKNPFYKGHAILMLYHESYIMEVKFSHIQQNDAKLAAELCFFFDSVRTDLNQAARAFIQEFNSEFEGFCQKEFVNLHNLMVCIDGLPALGRYVSLAAFAKLPGMQFSERRVICTDKSSMVVADTTCVGRWTGLNVLKYIFENHAAGKTWNGNFDAQTIFLSDGLVQIRVPYHRKFSLDAVQNDLLRYVLEVIPMFSLDKIGLPAFFTHLGKYLRSFDASHFWLPDQFRRFQRFASLTLALRSSGRRASLFRDLYKIRQARRRKALMRQILRSHIYNSDWESISGLQHHPILKRVYNHKRESLDSGSSGSATQLNKESQDCGGSGNLSQNGGMADKLSMDFRNTADGVLVHVRHEDEHGPDGPQPEDQQNEEYEGAVRLLSDIDLLSSHFLQDFSPDILEVLVFLEEMTEELSLMLEEVFEEYCQPEHPVIFS